MRLSKEEIEAIKEIIPNALGVSTRIATMDDIRKILQALTEAYAEIDRKDEALRFYAEQDNYAMKQYGYIASKVQNDCGATARQALEEKP